MAEYRTAAKDKIAFLDEGGQTLIDNGFSRALILMLASDDMSWRGRIVFFLTWRALATARHILRGESENIYRVLEKEIQRFTKEIGTYNQTLSAKRECKVGKFIELAGLYSRSGIVDPGVVSRLECKELSLNEIRGNLEKLQKGCIYSRVVSDSTESLKMLKGKVDLIVTDPPYGFNTSEFSIHELQRLYARFAENAVNALRPGGQLLLSIPSYARNGKQVPYFQTQGALVRQLISAANKSGRRLVKVIHTVPERKAVHMPPFYWTSPSAISRRIVWFTIGSENH